MLHLPSSKDCGSRAERLAVAVNIEYADLCAVWQRHTAADSPNLQLCHLAAVVIAGDQNLVPLRDLAVNGKRIYSRAETPCNIVRKRATVGVTLGYYKKVSAELRLNYEKYFYGDNVEIGVSDHDKFVAELMINF